MKTAFLKPLILAATCATAFAANAQVSLSVGIDIAPPALPIYEQPAIPGDGYMWTPGYWAWDGENNDYYWVPGTWVQAPYTGALWTPGYWGYSEGRYAWSGGYWGNHIGYYGGINYGHGYTGAGYQGGYWDRGAFNYNRTVNNVSNAHITNVYSNKVNVVQNTRVSYNGGQGGVRMTSSKNDQIINSMPHQTFTPPQAKHETDSRQEANQRLSVNHGMPKVAATPQPSSFQSEKVEPARPEPVAHASPQVHQQPHPNQQPKPNQQQQPHQQQAQQPHQQQNQEQPHQQQQQQPHQQPQEAPHQAARPANQPEHAAHAEPARATPAREEEHK